MNYWPLQDAKSRLSELVRKVTKNGPLGISVRGKEEVVLLSKEKYDVLIGAKPSFINFMANSPLKGVQLDLTRDKSPTREIDLWGI